MPLDRERLAKVLSLTQSNVDGEALAAIRKANEIIAGAGLSWDVVLQQIVVRQTSVLFQGGQGLDIELTDVGPVFRRKGL